MNHPTARTTNRTATANGAATLVGQLGQLGFAPGVPDDATDATFGAIGLDAACAASLQCEDCGHAGLAYLPLSAGTLYTGVMVCPSCHAQQEV